MYMYIQSCIFMLKNNNYVTVYVKKELVFVTCNINSTLALKVKITSEVILIKMCGSGSSVIGHVTVTRST